MMLGLNQLLQKKQLRNYIPKYVMIVFKLSVEFFQVFQDDAQLLPK